MYICKKKVLRGDTPEKLFLLSELYIYTYNCELFILHNPHTRRASVKSDSFFLSPPAAVAASLKLTGHVARDETKGERKKDVTGMMSRLLHAKLKRKEHETQRAAAAYSGREKSSCCCCAVAVASRCHGTIGAEPTEGRSTKGDKISAPSTLVTSVLMEPTVHGHMANIGLFLLLPWTTR